MQVTAFSPIFRNSVGFDRLSNLFETALQNTKTTDSYPPYNIEKLTENEYRITMAVAGFKPEEIKVLTQDDELTVSASAEERNEGVEYLYKGIATRSFQRKFSLSDYIKVTGANIADGLLTIDLMREIPEARKPRTIEVVATRPAVKTPQHAEVIENAVA